MGSPGGEEVSFSTATTGNRAGVQHRDRRGDKSVTYISHVNEQANFSAVSASGGRTEVKSRSGDSIPAFPQRKSSLRQKGGVKKLSRQRRRLLTGS